MSLIRTLFFILSVALGHFTALAYFPGASSSWAGMLIGAWIAGLLVVAEYFSHSMNREFFFSLFLGSILGAVFFAVIKACLEMAAPDFEMLPPLQAAIFLVCGFFCVGLVEGTKAKYKFLLPFVEISRKGGGNRPAYLDTSAIIDGRIVDVLYAHLMDNRIVVPKFVVNELQLIADSADKIKRSRGRRGLDILNKMQEDPRIDVEIDTTDFKDARDVDSKLVKLCEAAGGKLVTTDYNLQKVAKVHGIDVVNLNELAGALRPALIPGEHLEIRIVKEGEGSGQGVGYMEDGTMVVCEQGREYIGKVMPVTVSSVIQTSAGRMVFGRLNRG